MKHLQLFESVGDYKVLGTNESNWSWEDDSDYRTAEILLDTDDSLYLKINQVYTSGGLGSGRQRDIDLEFIKIGTLQKADLAKVRSLLKQHAHERTRAGSGFSKFWKDEEGNKMSLGDLLSLHKPEIVKKEMKHIKPISKFEEPIVKQQTNKDIELVKYSDRSYALFGDDTRNIKDQLIALGCKYNRFLTDPKTGQKRPGWIFAIGKLEKIKEII